MRLVLLRTYAWWAGWKRRPAHAWSHIRQNGSGIRPGRDEEGAGNALDSFKPSKYPKYVSRRALWNRWLQSLRCFGEPNTPSVPKGREGYRVLRVYSSCGVSWLVIWNGVVSLNLLALRISLGLAFPAQSGCGEAQNSLTSDLPTHTVDDSHNTESQHCITDTTGSLGALGRQMIY